MNSKNYNAMNWEEVESIIYADCSNPFSVLGVHKSGKNKLIQTFFADAESVEAVFECNGEAKNIKLEMVDESGFFAEFFSFDYSSYYFNVKKDGKTFSKVYDPYAFPVSVDSALFKNVIKGNSSKAHEIFGCHKKTIDGILGYEFCVYAPSASIVSLVGSFNDWKENANLMQKDKKHEGVFNIFIPGMEDNSEYKYVIKSKYFKTYKNDPFSFGIRNGNSLTCDISYGNGFESNDNFDNLEILEVDLISLLQKYKDKSLVLKNILNTVSKYSYNAVNILSLLSHTDKSDDYCNLFSLDLSEFSIEDYLFVFEGLKKKKIKVFTEHPLSYFSLYESGISKFDSSFLFENEDYRLNFHKYYNALLPDYSKPFTKAYALSSIDFMLSVFPLDGIVFSNLGVMLYHDYNKNPGEYITEDQNSTLNSVNVGFIKEINAFIHKSFEHVCTAAKIYAVYDKVTGKDADSLGFDYCFNTGATDVVLNFFSLDEGRRREQLDSFLLFTRQNEHTEKYIYPFSHEEIKKYSYLSLKNVNNDDFYGLSLIKLANIYKLLFDGSQLSDIDTVTNYETENDSIKAFNSFYNELRKDYIKFINADKSSINYKIMNDGLVTGELSINNKKYLLIFNFFDNGFNEYRLKLSNQGVYTEKFNSDKKSFGGKGMVNSKPLETEDIPGDYGEMVLRIPPLSICFFSFRDFTKEEVEERYQKNKARTYAYVSEEKKKIIDRLNTEIKELNDKAENEIKELERLLEPYDR